MKKQTRTAKVLVSLVGAMTFGACVLMALDNQSLSAGAFSLASYTDLNSINDVASPRNGLALGSWSHVEVFYSNTSAGDSTQLAKLKGLSNVSDLNFHFTVCNGLGANDGLIESTPRWKLQRPCLSGTKWYGNAQTIRVCVIANSLKSLPTDSQRKRTAGLLASISRKFDISPENISYPVNW